MPVLMKLKEQEICSTNSYDKRMNFYQCGSGKPLLLIHGLGSCWRTWKPVLPHLAAKREVIAVDLPGFGDTPPLQGPVSISTLAEAVTEFIHANGLTGVDTVGSSMGGWLVLELAQRGGVLGGAVALSPGGFWRGWERHFYYAMIYTSVRMVRRLQPLLELLSRHPIGRTLLFSLTSARPWRLSPEVALDEIRSYANSRSYDELGYSLVYGKNQRGASRNAIEHPLVIGWGSHDRICFPNQAERALNLFPDARLHWFQRSGHLPQWDVPQETVQLILGSLSD